MFRVGSIVNILGLLILHGQIRPGHTLILPPNKIANLFVLELFGGGLVSLRALSEDMFLDPVNSY